MYRDLTEASFYTTVIPTWLGLLTNLQILCVPRPLTDHARSLAVGPRDPLA